MDRQVADHWIDGHRERVHEPIKTMEQQQRKFKEEGGYEELVAQLAAKKKKQTEVLGSSATKMEAGTKVWEKDREIARETKKTVDDASEVMAMARRHEVTNGEGTWLSLIA